MLVPPSDGLVGPTGADANKPAERGTRLDKTPSMKGQPSSPPRRSVRRVLRLFAVTVALAGAGLAAYVWFQHRDDATNVALPDLDDQTDTAAYLTGSGEPLLHTVDTTTQLAGQQLDEDSCRTVAAELDSIATPTALVELAAHIPDPATADMFGNHLDAVMTALSTCTDQAVSTDDVDFTLTILHRRLSQLGLR